MELKNYQQTVIEHLAQYLALLREMDAAQAFSEFWAAQNMPREHIAPYYDTLGGVPNVCVKVPTGGGKTFIAACALAPIFDALPCAKARAVAWLVPSDSILEQTLSNLQNPRHPYHLQLRRDFYPQVYSKSALLNGQNFSPNTVANQLSVFVLSYDSFRTQKKEGRKAYQTNGSLMGFADVYNDKSILLPDTDETALINVIRALNPVVIVDESHHAVTPLSKEMLRNFNPSFVLDLTATPQKNANIISYVSAVQLKKENMVKLPVIVYNMRTKSEVIDEAIHIRGKLEDEAVAEKAETGRYIRPIVLFQAEPKTSADNTTFEKLKSILVETGIPPKHIAIKTAALNELRGVDLLSEDCPIRYIITVNALKEGWDCPFAYILATVANRSSVVDVEQILGRVLRLPHTAKAKTPTLNLSYCFTSSASFHETLERIVAGLQSAGFSDKDYRAEEFSAHPQQPPASEQQKLPMSAENEETDENIDVSAIRERMKERENASDAAIDSSADFLEKARQIADEYDKRVEEQTTDFPEEVRQKMNIFPVAAEFAEEIKLLRLPQFVISIEASLFLNDQEKLLAAENLMAGFTLKGENAKIDFHSVDAQMASIDADSSAPKARKLFGHGREDALRQWLNNQPPERRIAQCKSIICKTLNKNNALAGVREYVEEVLDRLSLEQIDDLQQFPNSYAEKIRQKIDSLLLAHRESVFKLWYDQGKIKVAPYYAFPKTIAPQKFVEAMPKSLYTAEEDMNQFEKEVAWTIANLQNIRWWHRNLSKSGFCLNGFENAYPDLIVKTENGKLLLIETKGDHLENAESKRKCYIGQKWAGRSGPDYRYFMVFRDKKLDWDGAIHFDNLIQIIKAL
ncbi:MAG: DEAD/DEAH box helicase family protein [Zoogloeaceae bacterium]|jgi:type III restriction enzyme|nr:DEAD/DEAH box helicase family protein [Zoogloeaceae bacterium]